MRCRVKTKLLGAQPDDRPREVSVNEATRGRELRFQKTLEQSCRREMKFFGMHLATLEKLLRAEARLNYSYRPGCSTPEAGVTPRGAATVRGRVSSSSTRAARLLLLSRASTTFRPT